MDEKTKLFLSSNKISKPDAENFDLNNDLKLSPEDALFMRKMAEQDCGDKVIEYLEKEKRKNVAKNVILFVCTIAAAVFAGISAIIVILQFIQ